MSLPYVPAQTTIGYGRVSTDAQADHLLDQCEAIRKGTAQLGLDLIETYEDVGSAHKKNACDDLLGLKDAMKRADELGAVILVRDASRISRNLDAYRKKIAPRGIRFLSLEHGGILTVEELEIQISRAEAEAKKIAKGTRDVLAKKPRSKVDSAEMRRRGAKDVERRRLAIEEDIIVGKAILREVPDITARQFGEALIAAGQEPPRGHSFTLDTARERLRATKAAIALDDEVADLDFAGAKAPMFAEIYEEQAATVDLPEDLAGMARSWAAMPVRRPKYDEDDRLAEQPSAQLGDADDPVLAPSCCDVAEPTPHGSRSRPSRGHGDHLAALPPRRRPLAPPSGAFMPVLVGLGFRSARRAPQRPPQHRLRVSLLGRDRPEPKEQPPPAAEVLIDTDRGPPTSVPPPERYDAARETSQTPGDHHSEETLCGQQTGPLSRSTHP